MTGVPVLRRLGDPVGGVPRAAPSGHRSLDVAAHAVRAGRSSACSTVSASSALYALLGASGLPTFYDKLLCVPLLNLAVPAIDRAVARWRAAAARSWLGLDGPLGRRQPRAHGGVDRLLRADDGARRAPTGMHRGDALPFWAAGVRRGPAAGLRAAAAASRRRTARDNAGWACNEMGRHYLEGRLVTADRGARRRLLLTRLRGAVPAGLRQPARCGPRRPRRSAAARPAPAAARGRAEPARHARARAVRPRVPPRLELRV